MFYQFFQKYGEGENKCAKSSNGVEAGQEMFKVNYDKNH